VINKPGGDCPECKGKIVLDPSKVGQSLTCPYCDAHLEVIGVDPLALDWGYDWMWHGEDEELEAKSKSQKATGVARAFCPDCDGGIRVNPMSDWDKSLSVPIVMRICR
jgi:lysine biosynthesis protein LysW